jgi:hypothetical protein
VHRPGAVPSAHALTPTLVVLAGSALVAAAFSVALVRTRPAPVEIP